MFAGFVHEGAHSCRRLLPGRFGQMRAANLNARRSYSSSFVLGAFKTRRRIPKGGGSGIKVNTVQVENARNVQLNRFARFVKYTRIPFLITAVYSVGYQQGIVAAITDPRKVQQGIFQTLCVNMGVNSSEDIDVIAENQAAHVTSRLGWNLSIEQQSKSKEKTVRVAQVGREIIRAARRLIDEELERAVKEAKDNLPSQNLSEAEHTKRVYDSSEVQFWDAARQRIESDSPGGIQNWQYILVGTKVPNAFVSEMLPQRFFVTTGLFDLFIDNDDELAMVLGHELSHVIHGHLSERNVVDFMLRGLEIFILAIDPTEGLMSLAVASFLASTREALTATHSRANEREADELGCKLAAMACYDTRRGAAVFQKMQKYDEEEGVAHAGVLSSHPPSRERFEFLLKLSADENLMKYSHCNRLRDRIQRALTARNMTE